MISIDSPIAVTVLTRLFIYVSTCISLDNSMIDSNPSKTRGYGPSSSSKDRSRVDFFFNNRRFLLPTTFCYIIYA